MEITFTIVSFVGSLCSAFSLILELLREQKRKDIANNNDSSQSLVSIPFLVISLSFLSLLTGTTIAYILSWDDAVIPLFVGLTITLIILVIYASLAHRSFDSGIIMSPRAFWQIIFNEIPSRIKNVDQETFSVLVLRMDSSIEALEASTKIVDSYVNRPDFQIIQGECINGEQEIPYNNNISGMICIIGEEGYEHLNKIESVLESYSNMYLNIPIAYVRVSKSYFKLKYARISGSKLSTCVNQLIMRSYKRSAEWIKLCSLYKKAFYIMLSIIVALLIGLALIGRKEIPLKLFSTYNDLEQVELDPQSLKKDEVLKRYLDNLNKLFFSQVQPKAVKIWVGTNNNKNLVNIYTSSNWDQSINDDKDAKSIIGGTAKNKIFVLWPGYKREFDNNVAWDANGPIKAKYNCETRTINLIDLKKEVIWVDSNNKTDSNLTMFCYAKTEWLAVELDFLSDNLDKSVVHCLQSLEFREQMRLYYLAVESYLSCANGTSPQINENAASLAE